ncbi:MAG: sugar phosphate isomerase/epimerase family protein [Candidatus Hodarchaeota archaeon]
MNESKSSNEVVIKKITDLCALLKPLRYNGIELSLLEPEKINVTDLLEVVQSYQIKIPALGTGSTFLRFGYSFGDIEESIRKKAIERMKNYIEFARETESKVIIGLIRGRYRFNNNPKKERLNIISSLKECCWIAQNNEVELLFEPINQFEIDSFNTIAQSLELLKEIRSDNLKLLIDSFHIYLEEEPGFIWEDLKEVAPLVGHLHLADTNRRAPGSGHFDFKTFLGIFKTSGYDGFASIETIMKPSFEEVARNSSEYLRLIL